MRIFLTTASILALIPSAYAADINADGAAHLKTIFEDIIKRQTESFSQNKSSRHRFDGEVNVETSDTYYAITLPHASVLHAENGRTEIGMVAINAIPHDDPNLWKMAVAIPTPIIAYDKDNKTLSRFDIGKQRAVGIWSEKDEYFVKLDARYQDLSFKNPAESLDISSPAASILYNLKDNGNDRWSGPIEMTLNNLNVKTAPDQDAEFEAVKINVQLYDYNLSASKGLDETEEPETVGSEEELDLAQTLIDHLANFGDGFGFEYAVSGASLSQPKLIGSGFHKLEFSHANLGLDVRGLDEDSMSLGLELGFEDLALPDPKHANAPDSARISMTLNDIPFSEIVTLGQSTMTGAIADPQIRQMAGLGLAMQLPALLSAAGTTLKIEDSYLKHDSYHIAISGEAKADKTAANSATANMHIEVTGMDWLVENIPSTAEDEEAKHDGMLIPMLIQLKDAAKIEGGKHVFDFIMDKQGQMLLNGQNAMALLMPQPPGMIAPAGAEGTATENSDAKPPPASESNAPAELEPNPAVPPVIGAPDQ